MREQVQVVVVVAAAAADLVVVFDRGCSGRLVLLTRMLLLKTQITLAKQPLLRLFVDFYTILV